MEQRMFRFTVRDLQWLTLVVGLMVGWWLNRAALTASFQSETNSLYRRLEEMYAENERVRDERNRAVGERDEMYHRMEDIRRLNAPRDQPVLRPSTTEPM
jgi:hypothetical protein